MFKVKFWGVRGSIPCPGPTTVEYAVMLGVIVFAAFATLSAFGDTVWGIYSAINDDLPT